MVLQKSLPIVYCLSHVAYLYIFLCTRIKIDSITSGLLNNFGMDSIVQRQNIRLADLVLMAIADLNSLKLIAQPSTIHQHLESKGFGHVLLVYTLNYLIYACHRWAFTLVDIFGALFTNVSGVSHTVCVFCVRRKG